MSTPTTTNDDVMLQWESGEQSVFNSNDLPFLRKSAGNGSGFVYFNPNSPKDEKYEKPRAIIPIPPELTAKRQRQEEEKMTRSASVTTNEKKQQQRPAHLRLHQQFCL
jgi:hypothetical protein